MISVIKLGSLPCSCNRDEMLSMNESFYRVSHKIRFYTLPLQNELEFC